MIGWYVHHVGRGHLHHALAIGQCLGEPVTGLSSLDRPAEWDGPWVQLARDDDGPIVDAEAHGVLHWAPLLHDGLRERMATIADWISSARPRAFVVDVSTEVAVLARLFGVPVITFCLPGVRTDAPHRMAWDLAEAIIAPWPERHAALCSGLEGHRNKVRFTGGISRLTGRPPHARARTARHGVVLGGLGGGAVAAPDVPGWTWTVLDARNWCADPWPRLTTAAVVITHAGLAAVADVAAARAPAVVVPQERPFGEQVATAAALERDRIAVVADPSSLDWARLVEDAVALGGENWSTWSDGLAASRAARVIEDAADRREYTCAS